jgi:hypothetical protein
MAGREFDWGPDVGRERIDAPPTEADREAWAAFDAWLAAAPEDVRELDMLDQLAEYVLATTPDRKE